MKDDTGIMKVDAPVVSSPRVSSPKVNAPRVGGNGKSIVDNVLDFAGFSSGGYSA